MLFHGLDLRYIAARNERSGLLVDWWLWEGPQEIQVPPQWAWVPGVSGGRWRSFHLRELSGHLWCGVHPLPVGEDCRVSDSGYPLHGWAWAWFGVASLCRRPGGFGYWKSRWTGPFFFGKEFQQWRDFPGCFKGSNKQWKWFMKRFKVGWT